MRVAKMTSRSFPNQRADAEGVMLAAEGRLVLGDGADWEAWSPQAAATAGRVIRVDLSAVTDIDAAGVGLLVRLAVHARCHGRELAIVAASPRVRQVLELVQVSGLAYAASGHPDILAAEPAETG